MCRLLKASRNSIYYNKKPRKSEEALERLICRVFGENRGVYGTRKIKIELAKETVEHESMRVSRRKIGEVMEKYGLVSKYTQKQYKSRAKSTNNDPMPNILSRKFSGRGTREAVVSDLTYVNVAGKWHYICLITDLSNREIIGFSAGENKSAQLVKRAICSIRGNLSDIHIFHTDRGSEFKNTDIDGVLSAFGIRRSLSAKGNPYDNAVAESLYHTLKTEFVFGTKFTSLAQLEYMLFDYVNWYNTKRIHGSLGYMSPVEYKTTQMHSTTVVA